MPEQSPKDFPIPTPSLWTFTSEKPPPYLFSEFLFVSFLFVLFVILSHGRKNPCCPPRPLPDQEYPCSCAQWMEQPGRGGPPGGAAATTTPPSVGMQKVRTYDRPPQTKRPSSRGPRPHPKGKPPTSGKSQGRSTREGRGGHEQREGRSGPQNHGAAQPRENSSKTLGPSDRAHLRPRRRTIPLPSPARVPPEGRSWSPTPV